MKLELKDKDIIWVLDKLRIKSPKFRRGVAFIEELINRLDKHHTFIMSAGIAFNIILYLIPLLLVLLYAVDLTVGSEAVLEFLASASENFAPDKKEITSLLTNTIHEVYLIFEGSSLAGWIGIVSLLWLSSILLSALRSGLNEAFEVPSIRTFYFYKFKDIVLIILLTILIIISSFVFPITSVVESYVVSLAPSVLEPIFKNLYIFLFSLATSFFLFYLIYSYVPNHKTERFTRIISITSSVVLTEASRHIFAWYIGGASAYGRFYGAYAIIAASAIWVYYFTFIILFSAELGKLIRDITKNKSD